MGKDRILKEHEYFRKEFAGLAVGILEDVSYESCLSDLAAFKHSHSVACVPDGVKFMSDHQYRDT